ncbi:DUF4145 domain-containing protein [Flavobacterium sp.]|uniref:DUF4145 domain-containing protein n=1 Tax=Flavobacterium sp. TaxID=239 RepID=UPI0026238C29|nr:DUF4145 domain-containing protein [Flavobacterium sp.]
MKYIQPEVFLKSFTCPNCGTISKQDWRNSDFYFNQVSISAAELTIGRCQHCDDITIWLRSKMIFPETGNCPFPNSEMPERVKKLYLEAASIHTKSPRGAAALLRLAIQVLCEELGEDGININTDIGILVSKGLPNIVQQSLDVVRVTGNDAVHPGQIDTDDTETVGQLFELINVIIEYMIALPKKVSGIYSNLPANKLAGINKRDGK